jgi:hypothetical protein
MARTPQISDNDLYQAACALLLDHGSVTVDALRTHLKDRGVAADTSRITVAVRRAKEDHGHERTALANGVVVDEHAEANQEQLPDAFRAASNAMERTVVKLLQQTRDSMRRESDARAADLQRLHEAVFAGLRDETATTRAEHADLQAAMTQLKEELKEEHQRAAQLEQALGEQQAQTERLQTTHHEETLRLMAQLETAQRDKDLARNAKHETEQLAVQLESQLERAREVAERELERAQVLEQKGEDLRHEFMSAREDAASIRARLEAKDALIARLEALLDRQEKADDGGNARSRRKNAKGSGDPGAAA